ncbi:MAG: RNA polymerase sigma-54 factor [Bacteroidetes bacterium GWE2_39_28]|nr:MAG: RNA polymerase sigma-54 factor [Bacteroidetes bacterium GWE2_39_28]OFY12183.1 MAG: RNA polymerase sigma-54 factor [Bacteroidetes bacterium GWF2_39_10]OFZ08952.1 MAG: RNA polymerase sigma-54 factor [Bacteroidetes bacterium RIFOXYB2_FULL_39_7]OFZ12339.1 MAG: RNA polymerase sigma-54 factor [Bacteroidetes bacterium RIFOXYC2_FULL_39_11]HCT94213.1 RNA polymerase sigma-54 factor [Rikenellaceae bacterium]
MLKQGLQQKLLQKLSPLQIQTIKLLELPTLELEQRIKKELEENPVLDEVSDSEDIDDGSARSFSLSEYSSDDQIPSYKLFTSNQGKDIKPEYNTFSVRESFHQSLVTQLGYSQMDARAKAIAKFIIGSLDDDGYLRRDLDALSDDISFRVGIETNPDELEAILKKIQDFEPVGIGARDLQECLLLQIKARERTPQVVLAESILEDHFSEFTKKHYQKILSRLSISEGELRDAIEEIVHLNPRPGGQIDDSYAEQAQQVVPDFVLEYKDGELIMTMPRFSVPELKVNKRYADLLMTSAGGDRAGKEAATFVKQKLDSAKWFIEAIRQRHNTLNNTMNAIIDFQREFFIEGDETKLRPMVLKNIAEKTNLDISTISRVVNCKYIQTHFGIYPLKYFFSEGLMTDAGEEVSTREIKNILASSIDVEDKKKPLTDEELVTVLHEKGYRVARRTVAKYREQLNIPIARLRKEL